MLKTALVNVSDQWQNTVKIKLHKEIHAHSHEVLLVAGEGFEPSKAEPGDLQSPPIGRSGNPPRLYLKQPA